MCELYIVCELISFDRSESYMDVNVVDLESCLSRFMNMLDDCLLITSELRHIYSQGR